MFEALIDRNQALLAGADTGNQAVSVETQSGKIFTVFGFSGDGVDRISQELLALIGNNAVTKIACQWAGSETADLPHIAVRQALMAQNEANAQALVLLWGEHGFNTRRLKDTF